MIRRTALVAIALCSLVMDRAQAAESPGAGKNAKKVDAELLEFLGSIDAEEDGWVEYLEQKPVKPAAGKVPQKPAPAARKPDPKQVKAK